MFAKKMSFFTRIGVWPWIQNRAIDPLMQVIRRGAEPKQLAFSAALGVTLGIFLICGTTVILCGVAIAMLGSRCNAVIVMVTPLELSLIVPFLCFGEFITGSRHFPLTSDAFKKVITGQASKDVISALCMRCSGGLSLHRSRWLRCTWFLPIVSSLWLTGLAAFRCAQGHLSN